MGPFERPVEPQTQVFGRYRLVEVLGAGGMAEVFLARLEGIEGFERTLAIKRILPHHSKNESFVSMFIDEAKLVGHFSHPNIVQLFDFGKIDDCYYISMEYIEGVSLAEIMTRHKAKNKQILLPAILEIGIQICRGIDYAHKETDEEGKPLGIIHRDLTPHNILVSRKGVVKITDFGIAKATMNTHMTQAGIIKGKVPYMSPEQATGLPLTHVSDIFSIGIVMYEMTMLERLFEGDNDFTTLRKVQDAEIPSIVDRNRDIPKELERILLRALARDREQRYQWASEMEADLTRLKFELGPEVHTFSLTEFVEGMFREREGRPGGAKRPPVRKERLLERQEGDDSVRAPEVEKSLSDLARGLSDLDDPLALAGSLETVVDTSASGGVAKRRPSLESQSSISEEISGADAGAEPSLKDGLVEPGAPEPTVMQQGTAPKKSSKRLLLGVIGLLVLIVAAVGGYMLIPRTGSIQVEVIPPDAEIYLNGEKVASQSPYLRTNLSPEEPVVVRVTKEGYKEFSHTVPIEARVRSRIPVRLEEIPRYGFLDVDTVPSGATIYLGGLKTDWVTPRRLNLPPDVECEITFVLEGYRTETRALSVKELEQKRVAIDLQPGESVPPVQQKTGGGEPVDDSHSEPGAQ